MKKIVIIGCGFAGLAACIYFKRHGRGQEITLIDKKDTFDFLPMLPDCLGRGISPDFLSYPIEVLSKIYGFVFLKDEVRQISLKEKIVSTSKNNIHFDYLLIASGSETNFYGDNKIPCFAYKLDDVADAKTICQAIELKDFDMFVISGGGYTGVEIASNLRLLLDKKKSTKQIIIVERTSSILGPIPDWMKNSVINNLGRQRVDILTGKVIAKVEADNIFLSDGQKFSRAMFIWAAGVRTADYCLSLSVDKTPQGRLKVDEYLRISETCFVAGDCAYFEYQKKPLRMAVQFAISQGENAARNILASISEKRLRKFSPRDLGLILPMANNRSCGVIFGLNVTGILATMFHYLMCLYRSYSLKNRLGIIKDLMKI